ncbi:hypothetical protein D3C75_1130530 [compost metagenome]
MEFRIGIPGFVKFDPGYRLGQLLGDGSDVINQTVVSAVSDDGISGAAVFRLISQHAVIDFLPDRAGLKLIGRDQANNAEPITRRLEIDGFSLGDGQLMVDGLVAIAVNQDDFIF